MDSLEDQTCEQEKLMDFTDLFKTSRQPPKLNNRNIKKADDQVSISTEGQSPVNENIQINRIPTNVTITQEEMKIRRCLDLRRWYCLSRPQYQRTCGISSVVTVWNYLFSTLGVGSLPPVSQEDAIVQLNLAKQHGPHFNDIDFGNFSGNMSLITWFKNLCRIYKVKGRSYYLWKVAGKNSTPGIDRHVALDKLKTGLQSDKCSYIYHAYDHYFCPVGYEITPNRGYEAYEQTQNIDMDSAETWMIIAEPAKPQPFFTVKKWKDIAQDIELEYPQYINIRKLEEGIKEFKNVSADGQSQHCIMAFERVEPLIKKLSLDQQVKISLSTDVTIEDESNQNKNQVEEQKVQFSEKEEQQDLQIKEQTEEKLEEKNEFNQENGSAQNQLIKKNDQ